MLLLLMLASIVLAWRGNWTGYEVSAIWTTLVGWWIVGKGWKSYVERPRDPKGGGG